MSQLADVRVDPEVRSISAEDVTLVRRLRGGESGAFDQAYALYHASIYSFLRRLSNRADVADDLFQETWLSLARAAPGLSEDTRLAAWLFTVARNAYRSYRRWQLLDFSRWAALGEEHGSLSDAASDPEKITERQRGVLRVERALSELPPRYREVLLLIGVEGLEQTEVARILGVGYATLRKRLSRARTMLTGNLQALEGGLP